MAIGEAKPSQVERPMQAGLHLSQRSRSMTLFESEHQTLLLDDRQKLTPETVRAFVKKLHVNRNLKAKVIAALDAKGLAGMAEDFFALSERQQKLLDGHRKSPREMRQITRDAIRNALTTNGTIEVVHSNSPLRRTSIGIGVEIGPVGISVSINC